MKLLKELLSIPIDPYTNMILVFSAVVLFLLILSVYTTLTEKKHRPAVAKHV